MRILVVGSGPVARALGGAWERTGHEVVRRRARDPDGGATAPADAVLVAVPDRAIGAVAEAIVAAGAVPATAVLLHAAGALAPEEVFAPVRARVAGVALCHPLVSLADGTPERLAGALFAVVGDEAGARVAEALARAAGGEPVRLAATALGPYHAAAALCANHSLALVAAALDLMVDAGVARDAAARGLGRLLGSTADNVARLGLPAALTGPVARGDVEVVARHLASLPPRTRALYRETARALLPLAAAKGVAPSRALADLAALLDGADGD